jgi:hypothetical protein
MIFCGSGDWAYLTMMNEEERSVEAEMIGRIRKMPQKSPTRNVRGFCALRRGTHDRPRALEKDGTVGSMRIDHQKELGAGMTFK